MTLFQGKKYALVGESGSGKSTLLNLLVKEQPAERGQIFVNGKDLADIPYSEIGTHISYMNQNVYLFNDTIKNNIKAELAELKRQKGDRH